MSLHLHYLVDKKCNSLLEWLCFLFLLWFHPTKWSWILFIFAWFDHTWYETHWNSMIERTKTLISVDFESILKAIGRTLFKHLEKRALKTHGKVSQMMILICGWKWTIILETQKDRLNSFKLVHTYSWCQSYMHYWTFYNAMNLTYTMVHPTKDRILKQLKERKFSYLGLLSTPSYFSWIVSFKLVIYPI